MTATALEIPIEAEVDKEGYLVEPAAWSEDIARAMAEDEGIELEPDHWKVFGFMRQYYADHGIAADARFVIKYLANELGYGKTAKARLFELFPYGYVKQACRLAGMKRPRAWSTG